MCRRRPCGLPALAPLAPKRCQFAPPTRTNPRTSAPRPIGGGAAARRVCGTQFAFGAPELRRQFSPRVAQASRPPLESCSRVNFDDFLERQMRASIVLRATCKFFPFPPPPPGHCAPPRPLVESEHLRRGSTLECALARQVAAGRFVWRVGLA